jgi:hypothetical protein
MGLAWCSRVDLKAAEVDLHTLYIILANHAVDWVFVTQNADFTTDG